ncbi:MAG: hypothetical protein OCD02_17470 [Spirochaetaceae bacterium]
MYKHLSPFGNISKIKLVTSQLNSPISHKCVPLEVAIFKPDSRSPYYRYITNKLGLIMPKLSKIHTKENLFDLIIISKQEDTSLIMDMNIIIQDIIDINGYIDDEGLCFTLIRNNIEHYYLSLYVKKPNCYIKYNSDLKAPLLQLIPITLSEYLWIQDSNKKWGDQLGFYIFREWFEFRELTPLGSDVKTSILTLDLENLNNMIKEIGTQFREGNDDEWYTEQTNPDYCQVFQNFIRRSAIGSVDSEIEEGGLLISTGNYNKAITYYKNLIEQDPKNRAQFLEQIGAAYFFKEQYHKAKEYYIQAVNSGSKTIDFNLWEVCELLSNKEQNNNYLKEYINYFPDGEYKHLIKNIMDI